ncbi:hypothetical protein [Jannaschia sp. 2305UL9-9]|uniref:hypothetical protein n=1 Tax=Jannaschia sp. 2305UL9-9 TaxID=3121638 RepID=UPI00352724CC
MLGRCLAIAVLFLMVRPEPILAQIVEVRSGEHAEFSRLVFPAPRGTEWVVEQASDREVRLAFDVPGLRFDLGRVFDFIPKDRLSDLRADGANLEIALGCDCTIGVEQIASGHMVIDIRNRVEPAAPPAPRPEPDVVATETTAQVPVLPLQLSPVSTLAAGLRLPMRAADMLDPGIRDPVQRANATLPEQPRANDAPRPQITIREHRRSGLVTSQDSRNRQADGLPKCSLETVATSILMEPPSTALADLPAARMATLDDADGLSAPGLTALARTYLTLGWGTEARQALTLAGVFDGDLIQMAIAMDGDPNMANATLDADPACGPATTLLLLVAGQFAGDWGSVDEETFVRFIDRLPDERRTDLETRLNDGLARLGQSDLMGRLIPLPAPLMPYTPPSSEISSAGTGTDAIRASMDLLMEQQDGTVPTEPIHLQNALALRLSIPAGPLRDEFDDLLARRLLLSGHVAEAISVVQERPDLADALLTVALQELPEADLLEVAIRLRPFIPSDAPQIEDVAEIMRGFGLSSAARDFVAIRTGEGLPKRPTLWRRPASMDGTRAVERLSEEDRAWLDRDFNLIAQADGMPPETPRQRAAALIAARNTDDPPVDDFDRAEMALETSRRVSDVMQRLLDQPG